MSRDPFPMQSDAAKRLSAGEEDAHWSSMSTMSSSAVPIRTSEIDSNDNEVHQDLMGNSVQKKNNLEDDDSDDDDDEDAFLDRPLWESRSQAHRSLARCKRFFEKVYHRLYGDKLPISEMLRTLCLATTLFYLIGGYWIMRSLKDPILTSICGVNVIPKAKMLSVFVVLAVVSIYNRFLDTDIPRHKLFYIFGTFYFFLFMTIAYFLAHPTIGLQNQRQSPWRLLGWVAYCTTESYGSVMVSLFWSFTNSNFSLESAKASYGVLIAFAQLGSILGPTFVSRYAETVGVTFCYVVGACCLTFLQVTIYTYITLYGAVNPNLPVKPQKKTKADIFEGVKLFWEYNYVKGIFAISCVFMICGTIIDYTLKMLARDYFAEEHPCLSGMSCFDAVDGVHGMSEDATAAFTSFMGFFGQATNSLSFVFSLFGTSAVIRFLGLRWTLLLFPSLILFLIILVRLHPTLYVAFGAMMTLKAGSYALNNPTKEILYQPTSSIVKYKAKSWIDIFGARGSKALGSVVTNAFSHSSTILIQNGSLVGMCVASFLIWNATFMGRKFDEYTASGYVVGDDPSEKIKDYEMANDQNPTTDTSCAIYDDSDLGAEDNNEGEESPKVGPFKPTLV
jgi:AAA family ATP:ADP antiporter